MPGAAGGRGAPMPLLNFIVVMPGSEEAELVRRDVVFRAFRYG